MRTHICLESWELSYDEVSHMIKKGKQICDRKWMLTNDYMETLGMPFFVELVDLVLSKISITKVDEQRY